MRATLAQVANDMYNALMGAHTAMDQIQLAVQQIPTHVKTILKLLSSASDAMIKSMLPRTLDSIGRLANESATVANATLVRFNLLQDLLGEIIELSASTRAENENDIITLNRQKNESLADQKILENTLKTIEEQYAQSKIEVENARKNYADAMEKLKESNMPILESNGNPGFNLLKTVVDFVTNPIETVGNFLNGLGSTQSRVDNSKYENARETVRLAIDRLEKAEQNYNHYVQRQLAEQSDLVRIINDISLLDFTTLNTNETIRLLIEATKHIEIIRDQWTRMIRFFSKLAIQARSTQQVRKDDSRDNDLLVICLGRCGRFRENDSTSSSG